MPKGHYTRYRKIYIGRKLILQVRVREHEKTRGKVGPFPVRSYWKRAKYNRR